MTDDLPLTFGLPLTWVFSRVVHQATPFASHGAKVWKMGLIASPSANPLPPNLEQKSEDMKLQATEDRC